MNNAKIWLVVKPTVGIPLLLSAVAISSFAVHVGIIANTSWIEDYHQGLELGTTAQNEAALARESEAKAAAYAPPAGGQQVLVLLPDGTTARAVLEPQSAQAASFTPEVPLTPD